MRGLQGAIASAAGRRGGLGGEFAHLAMHANYGQQARSVRRPLARRRAPVGRAYGCSTCSTEDPPTLRPVTETDGQDQPPSSEPSSPEPSSAVCESCLPVVASIVANWPFTDSSIWWAVRPHTLPDT
jgi:hypothetical protein